MFNYCNFFIMQSSIFPKNYLRKNASFSSNHEDSSSLPDMMSLYCGAFDTLPSVEWIYGNAKWINQEQSCQSFFSSYLFSRDFDLLFEIKDGEDYSYNEDNPMANLVAEHRRCHAFVNAKHKIMVMQSNSGNVRIFYDWHDTKALHFIQDLKEAYLMNFEKIQEDSDSRVNYISYFNCEDDYELKALDVKADKSFDLQTLYNDDFVDTDMKIRSFLSTPDKSGLIILHGLCGTGKTSYIKNLVCSTQEKFVFVPMDIAEKLTSPDFIDFVRDRLTGSVIVLEDCEQLLFARNKAKNGINTGLAALLNLTDGILGDALNLKFICTFNNDLYSIDPALLRPGRLVARYDFDKLSSAKTTSLMNKLNHEGTFEAMSLAEIFNYK